MRKIACMIICAVMMISSQALADGYGFNYDQGNTHQIESFNQTGSWMNTPTLQNLEQAGGAAVFGKGEASFLRTDWQQQTYLYKGNNVSGLATQNGEFGGNNFQIGTIGGNAKDPNDVYSGYCINAKQWSDSTASGNGAGTANTGWVQGDLKQTANQSASGAATNGTVSVNQYTDRTDGYQYSNTTPAATQQVSSQGNIKEQTIASGPAVYTAAIAGQESAVTQNHDFGALYGHSDATGSQSQTAVAGPGSGVDEIIKTAYYQKVDTGHGFHWTGGDATSILKVGNTVVPPTQNP